VPAAITTIVMKAAPGSELTCRAHEMDVEVNGNPVRRGIISYYATSTMRQATDFQSWLELIEQQSGEDLVEQKISLFRKPTLRICGNPSTAVIGE
jgi:hypothetical protein